MKLKDLPVFEGWMSLPDAARALGIQRQRIHQLVERGDFKTAMRIGTFAIVREAEVQEKVLERKRQRDEAQQAKGGE